MTASLRILSTKPIQTLGELHKEWTEAGVSASRVTTLRVFRKRATKPLLKQKKHRQKHLNWAKEKKNWTVAQWPKVLFSDKSNFAFHLEIKVWSLEEGVERHRIQLLEVQCEVSEVRDDLGFRDVCWCGPLCFIKAKVNAAVYQEILEHFMLPSAEKLYGDADFLSSRTLAPAHSAKPLPSALLTMIYLLDWPANMPDLNPIWNLWDISRER